MLYNCTFPQNDTLNNACCSASNITNALKQNESACIIGIGNAEVFTSCLVEKGNVTDYQCYLQDWSNTPSNSAATPVRPKAFGWASLACVGLLLLGGVQGQVQPAKDPECSKFVPDDQSSWDLSAETRHIILSWALLCSVGVDYCSMGMDSRPMYFEPVWAADGPDGPVPVTGDFGSLSLPEDRAFADKVNIPYVPDRFAFAEGSPGMVAVKTSAAIIPGVFRDCKNGTDTEFRGNVTVPEARGLYYFIALSTALAPSDGPNTDHNESMPTWQFDDGGDK